MVPIQVSGGPQIRGFPKLNPNRNDLKREGPAVTVFVGELFKSLYLHNVNI